MTSIKSNDLIEVVGIYPVKDKKAVMATFHIYLINENMDIRGGVILRGPKGPFIKLPHMKGWDEDRQEMVTFPVISFPDSDYEKRIKKEVQKKVKEEFKRMKHA